MVYAFAFLFVASSIVPMTAFGHAHDTFQPQLDGDVVAQQDEANQSNEGVTAIIEWLNVTKKGDEELSSEEEQQIENDLQALQSGELSEEEEKQRLGRISNLLDYEPPTKPTSKAPERDGTINNTIANVFNKKIGGFTPKEKLPENGDEGTIQVVTEISRLDVGYDGLSLKSKEAIKTKIRSLQINEEEMTHREWDMQFRDIVDPLGDGVIDSITGISDEDKEEIRQILEDELGSAGRQPEKEDLGINFNSWMEQKLEALAELFEEGFNWVSQRIYDLTLNTPVPENTGWKGILGEPTNEPFKSLYNGLLVEKIYPVTNSLLGLGIIFLGLSLTVNPVMSEFRIWDLLIKFVTGLMLYAFSWTAVTLMHKFVKVTTEFLMPNPGTVTDSATNLLAFSSGIPVAAYLGGAFVGSSAAFGVGLLFGLRQVLLTSVFPYIFGPLALTAYLAPWTGLKRAAHKAIWQYINILTMSIPIAIILQAAVTVKWGFGFGGFVGVLAILGLFIVMLLYPLISTYFFLQMPGYIGSKASVVATGAANRVGAAKQKVGWGSSATASDSGATSGTTVEEMTNASEASSSGSSRQNTSTSYTQTTLASKIRDKYDREQAQQSRSSASLTPEAMKEAFLRDDRSYTRTTMGDDK